MCMINILIQKEISKQDIVPFLKENKIKAFNNYLYAYYVCGAGVLNPLEKEFLNDNVYMDWLKAYEKKDIIEEKDVIFHNFQEYDNYHIIGIETENSAKNCFTALGSYDSYIRLSTCLNQDINIAIYQQIERRNYSLLDEDLKNWFSLFANAFEKLKMNDIGIYYMYPEKAETPQIGKYKKLEELTKEDLLKMEANKILFIEK